VVTETRCGVIGLPSVDQLPVSVVQDYVNSDDAIEADYVHGSNTVTRLGTTPSMAGLLLPDFDQGLLFPTIEADGVLPRKAFSLGEAQDKKYYLEARMISV
jgi:hypothetical protein